MAKLCTTLSEWCRKELPKNHMREKRWQNRSRNCSDLFAWCKPLISQQYCFKNLTNKCTLNRTVTKTFKEIESFSFFRNVNIYPKKPLIKIKIEQSNAKFVFRIFFIVRLYDRCKRTLKKKIFKVHWLGPKFNALSKNIQSA